MKNEALAVKINNLHIGEVCKKSIKESVNWFTKLESKLTKKEKEISYRILKELNEDNDVDNKK